MRRRADAEKRVAVMPRPSPLHETAAASNRSALQLAMLPTTASIPSSHPYYRSSNVLATPRTSNHIGQSPALAAAAEALHSARAVKSPFKPRMPYETMPDTPRALKSPMKIDTRARYKDTYVPKGVNTSGLPSSLNTLCLTASAMQTGFNREAWSAYHDRRNSVDLHPVHLRRASLGGHKAAARIVLPPPPYSPTARRLRHSRNRSDGHALRSPLPSASNLRFIEPRIPVGAVAYEERSESARGPDVRDVQMYDDRVDEESLRRYAVPQTPHKESFLRGGRVEVDKMQNKRCRDSDIEETNFQSHRLPHPRSANGSRQPTPVQSPLGEQKAKLDTANDHPSKRLRSESTSNRSSSAMSHRSQQESTKSNTSDDGNQPIQRRYVFPQKAFASRPPTGVDHSGARKPISLFTAVSGNHRSTQTQSAPAEGPAGQAPGGRFAHLKDLAHLEPQHARAISSGGGSIPPGARVIDLSNAPPQVHALSIARSGHATIAPPGQHRVLIPPRPQLSVPATRMFGGAMSADAARPQARGSILEQLLAEVSSKAATQDRNLQGQTSATAGQDAAATALEQVASQLAEAARKLRGTS